MNIAILGATSHIAKGLIFRFLGKGEIYLDLYTRSSSRMLDFLGSIKKISSEAYLIHQGYSDLLTNSHDVVINCVGVGTQNKLKGNYSLYFTVTEKYDNLVIDYLHNMNSGALYISFSSGAVYGRGHLAPVEEDSLNAIKVNQVVSEDYYGIARLNAEAKHRSLQRFRIVDLRIFSYFSRFIDLTDSYFITDVLDAILNRKVFITDCSDMVRDYLHPEDLFSMVTKCINLLDINEAFDVCSSKPVTKTEILNYFSSKYRLEYEVSDASDHVSATGFKNIYCSNYNGSSKIGYMPKFSSMDAIKHGVKYIIF